MMKRVIIFLLLTLSGSVLYAQDVIEGKKPGDLLKGNRVTYRLDSSDYRWELYNIKNQIAKSDDPPEGWLRYPYTRQPSGRGLIDYIYGSPASVEEKIIKIFRHILTSKELTLLKEDGYIDLIIRCYMTLEGRVQEVSFRISMDSTEIAALWRNFPMNRFYRIERKIIRKLNEGKQGWFQTDSEWRQKWADKNGKDVEKIYLDIDVSDCFRSKEPLYK